MTYLWRNVLAGGTAALLVFLLRPILDNTGIGYSFVLIPVAVGVLAMVLRARWWVPALCASAANAIQLFALYRDSQSRFATIGVPGHPATDYLALTLLMTVLMGLAAWLGQTARRSSPGALPG